MIFPSQARKESMALAFAELDKVANPVICEVGRARNVYAAESDGHSTLAFADYATFCGGTVLSIDSDPCTQLICHGLMQDNKVPDSCVTYINKDAIRVFSNGGWSDRIDLFYLDGWDLINPISAKSHLLCFLLAEAQVKPNGLVLIDDTGYPDLGKGKLVVPVAVMMGWTVLHQGFQTLLRKPV